MELMFDQLASQCAHHSIIAFTNTRGDPPNHPLHSLSPWCWEGVDQTRDSMMSEGPQKVIVVLDFFKCSEIILRDFTTVEVTHVSHSRTEATAHHTHTHSLTHSLTHPGGSTKRLSPDEGLR